MMPTRLAISSAACSVCVDISTHIPAATSRFNKSFTSRMLCGSSPIIGSSTTSTRGACSSAEANTVRCFIP